MRAVKIIQQLLRDDRGATAIEYGLIVALICIAMMGALGGVANENTGLWGKVREKVMGVR